MGPLEGVRVLDLSMVVSGPFCTMMLGDLGADVIKIEPPEGDVARSVPGPSRNGVPAGILNWNRSKRDMILDLKKPGAADVFLRMVEKADVVVQNVRPGVVDRLGVGYDACAARNPKIVYCSIAGYGFSGPYKDKPAYDSIIQGIAGAMTVQTTQGKPRVIKTIVGDKVTGMTSTISILAALHAATTTGKGQHVKIAMIDALAYFLMGDTLGWGTFLPIKPGRKPVKGSPDPIQTADGYITISPFADKHWAALLKGLGHPEWFEGDESRDEKVRKAMWKMIDLFKTKPSAYWLEIIEKADVPCGIVNDYDTIWSDPQFVANGSFPEYTHPKAGPVRVVRTPARFSRTDPEFWRHAPDFGQHTDEILRQSGFSDSEISNLREAQVVR